MRLTCKCYRDKVKVRGEVRVKPHELVMGSPLYDAHPILRLSQGPQLIRLHATVTMNQVTMLVIRRKCRSDGAVLRQEATPWESSVRSQLTAAHMTCQTEQLLCCWAHHGDEIQCVHRPVAALHEQHGEALVESAPREANRLRRRDWQHVQPAARCRQAICDDGA